MNIDFLINGSSDPSTRYLGWSRTKFQIRFVVTANESLPSNVIIRNSPNNNGGKVIFLNKLNGAEEDQLLLPITAGITTLDIYIAGKFPHCSKDGKDVRVELLDSSSGNFLFGDLFMVRVRKNANTLSLKERNLFLETLQKINDHGSGRFADFRKVHSALPTKEGSRYYYQAHGEMGFLPWHRAFLLDLEREMQLIDSRVSLPYWKFDEVANNVFTQDFMGSHSSGDATFSISNPLSEWRADGTPIRRSANFDVENEPAKNEDGVAVLSDEIVIKPGMFKDFRHMEDQPHGIAHTSFDLDLTEPHTAVKDPLFFLLHTNIDRIWARWQWEKDLFDKNKDAAYPQQANNPPGHNLNDTMWPWNQLAGGTRPAQSPGGTMAASPIVNAPGPSPTVGDMIDWQGRTDVANQLGFDYDDIPFSRFSATHAPLVMAGAFDLHTTGFTMNNLHTTEMLTSEVKSLALATITDQEEETGIRKMVIQKSGASIRSENEFFASLLAILKNTNENADLRLSSLIKLQQLRISSPKFQAWLAEFLNTLRGLVEGEDEKLRTKAVTILAMMKDGFVRERLINGLIHPDAQLISPKKAIQLLGYDVHADLYPILTHIIENSSDEDARKEAVILLGHDAASAELISNILLNKNESGGLRIAAAKGLQSANMDLFNGISKVIIADDEEDLNLRTMLLNSLSFNTDVAAIGDDNGFIKKVGLINSEELSSQLQTVSKRFLNNFR